MNIKEYSARDSRVDGNPFDGEVFPMFFLIAIWGGDNSKYASVKFFIYTFTASVIKLVGFMELYFEAGVN